jgi:hypothetical protein
MFGKAISKETLEKMLSCGKNYRPKEITDKKFYFHKGYLIALDAEGGFTLYSQEVYNSTTTGDILKKAMDRIVQLELNKFDRCENLRAKVEKEIQKRVEPFITEIVAQVLKGQK